MAESLSRLALKDAKQSAESAKQQLKTAKPRSDGSSVSPEDLERAEQELDKQRAWVDDLLKKAQERESERAKEALGKSAKREQEMAERAQKHLRPRQPRRGGAAGRGRRRPGSRRKLDA